jgi:hypothetical protein
MKTCIQCNLEKDTKEFHKDSGRTDGHTSRCKHCACANTRAWNRKHRFRVHPKRPYDPEAKKRWASQNPEKVLAHNAVNHAIRDGLLIRGECELRGVDCRGRIEGHHDDYSLPLQVRWLCKMHHEQEHCGQETMSA